MKHKNVNTSQATTSKTKTSSFKRLIGLAFALALIAGIVAVAYDSYNWDGEYEIYTYDEPINYIYEHSDSYEDMPLYENDYSDNNVLLPPPPHIVH